MKHKTIHFIRHYVEMVLAMFIGMGVLGAAGAALGIELDDTPELLLLSMAFSMTVPMVAWMRYRGHGWAPAWEMTGSMLVPSVAAIALLWIGAVEDNDTLLAIQHSAMFPAMLLVMLLRLDEYTARHA